MAETVGAGQWSAGLFGCFGDIKLCLLVYLAPCYVHGKNAHALGEDSAWFTCIYFWPLLDLYFLAKARGKTREIRGIPGSFIMDILMHFFCHPCALQQEATELNSTSWDAAIKMDRF